MICPKCGSEFKSRHYPLVCTCGLIVRADLRVIEHASDRRIPTGIIGPDGKLQPFNEETRLEFAARAKARRDEKGRAAWKARHEYLGCDKAWLVAWEKTIPNIGCDCMRDYLKLKVLHPPDFSSPEAFFVSGVVLHNAVNEKLGKPQFTIEEAMKLWNRT